MLKIVEKMIIRLFPELDSKTHLPLLAVVVSIPDPPADGGKCTPERPRYAVDVRMLTPDLTIDGDMPLMRDVPVAMTGAANGRGLASLPQPGTIVEIAFAFGRQSLPFIRSVLPDQLQLPEIDAMAQRWQQTPGDYQEVDAAGNWTRQGSNIIDQANTINLGAVTSVEQSAGREWSAQAPKVWLGSESENVLRILSEYMQTVSAALGTLASHTHPNIGGPEQGGTIGAQSDAVTAQKARIDTIKK
jgi:hypothetical protein